MRIQFVKEDGTYFAISQDQEWNGFMYEEMLWAEIALVRDSVTRRKSWEVKWESDYGNPRMFNSLVEAKKYIEKEYFKFTPTSNGGKYKL